MKVHVKEFLIFIKLEKHVTENTVLAYRNDLNNFTNFVGDIDPTLIGRKTVQEFIDHLHNRDPAYALSTIARKMAALRTFFQYLKAEGLILSNPTAHLEIPKVKRLTPILLTNTEINLLLEQPLKCSTPEAPRDRAMLELLCATGLRVTEMVKLDIDNVVLDKTGTDQSYVCVINGKKINHRTIPLKDRAVLALSEYLANCRPGLVKKKMEKALFLNRSGERLSRQGFWLIFKGYVDKTEITSNVTPHTLRHSFATQLLKKGMAWPHVQKLLGHAQLATTKVYSQDIALGQNQEVYERTQPQSRTALA